MKLEKLKILIKIIVQKVLFFFDFLCRYVKNKSSYYNIYCCTFFDIPFYNIFSSFEYIRYTKDVLIERKVIVLNRFNYSNMFNKCLNLYS